MAKDKKQKDISINDLAVMMNNRFDGVDKRLGGVEKRLDNVENGIDGVRQKLDRLENKTDTILLYAQSIDKELSRLKKDTERKETSYVTKSALRKIVGRG